MNYNDKFLYTIRRSAGKKIYKHEICEVLNITHKTLNSKIANRGIFKLSEIIILKKKYNISDADLIELFINDQSCEN